MVYYLYVHLLEKRKADDLKRNHVLYSKLLAGTLNDIRITSKSSITVDDTNKLLEVLEKFPKTKLVKDVKKVIEIYKRYVSQHPSVHLESEIMRKTVILPLIKKFLILFSSFDSELYDIISREQNKYIEKKIALKVYAASLLEKVIKFAMERSNINKDIES